MNRPFALFVALSLSLSVLLGCPVHEYGIPNPNHRPADVAPVPIDKGTVRTGLPKRLTRWIDGSQAWDGDRRAGYWMATYTGGDTIIAELDWSPHYLRAEVKVKDDEVEIKITDSEGLDQYGEKIHKLAVLHVGSLRRTIRTALRSGATRKKPGDAQLAEQENDGVTRPARDIPRPTGRALSPQLLGRYHALVIGNDAYTELPRLRTAIADARAISRLLEHEYDFEVTLLENAGREQIVSALNGYRASLEDSDNLLIFYAGHGWFDEDAQRGYWLPVDARQGDPTHWVSNATITDMLLAIPARHVLVVADSCYSGTLTRGIRASSQDRHLARLAERRSRTALTSGGLEPVEDGRGRHSVFATAFVTRLEANDGILDAQSLFSDMRRPVMLESDQTPEYSDIRRAGHDGGDFLFSKRR